VASVGRAGCVGGSLPAFREGCFDRLSPWPSRGRASIGVSKFHLKAKGLDRRLPDSSTPRNGRGSSCGTSPWFSLGGCTLVLWTQSKVTFRQCGPWLAMPYRTPDSPRSLGGLLLDTTLLVAASLGPNGASVAVSEGALNATPARPLRSSPSLGGTQ
jgi:hypothetical protein